MKREDRNQETDHKSGNEKLISLLVSFAFIITTILILITPALAQPFEWGQVNTDGFGDTNNIRSWSMAVFNDGTGDKLYVGTENTNGTEVWRYNGSTWNQVNTDGFGDTNNKKSYCMAVFNDGTGDKLYVGTDNTSTGTEVWRTAGVGGPPYTDWTQVNTDGFGSANNRASTTMGVYNDGTGDKLYAGTWNNTSGTEVWRTAGVGGPPYTDWTQVNAGGFGVGSNPSSWYMQEYNGFFYMGTYNAGGGQVWRTAATGGPPYTDWTQVNTDGFGSANNKYCRSLVVYGGSLYVGTNNTAGGQVWRTVASGGPPYTDWTQVNTDGFGSANTALLGMLVYDGSLYVGTYNAGGGQVWRTDAIGGSPYTDWTQENTAGFGDVNNRSSSCMGVYNNDLYVGTQNNSTGTEVWGNASLDSLTPDNGNQGTTIDVAFAGTNTNWTGVATGDVDMGAGITVNSVTPGAAPDTQFTANVTIDNAAPATTRDVTVTVGVQSVTRPGGFTVTEVSLEVIKAAVSGVPTGFPITYTITITNSGDGDANAVEFTDNIPDHTSVVTGSVTCSDAGASIDSEDPVEVTGITVMTGKTVTVTFQVTIDEGTQPGKVIENQGFVKYGSQTIPSSDPDHPGEGRPTGVTVNKPLGSMAWLVAEGSTGEGFDTFILMQNPNNVPAPTAVAFSTEDGIQDGTALVIPPNSRTTMRLSDYMPDQWSISTMVAAEVPIVVERSMYWNSEVTAYPYEMMSGHANLGLPAPMEPGFKMDAESDRSTDQFFPEGSTSGFDTWILLFNPMEEEANAKVTLMDETGPVVEENVTIGPLSRKTVHLNKLLPDANQVATRVESDTFLVAERSMYWDPAASAKQPYEMIGGHSTAGSPIAANGWFIAEGSTGGGFETFVLLQNPSDTEAPLTLTFMDATGVANQATTTMPAQSRSTFKVSDYVQGNFHVSTSIVSDVAIVAERSMYWDNRETTEPSSMKDGHSCIGEIGAASTWMVAEGSTGGGFDTFVLVTNTEDTEATAAVTFMTENGPQTPFNITVGANSRYTLRISDSLPDTFQVSTLIQSDRELVVERSMYWDNRQISSEGNFPVRPFECIGGHSANGLDP